MGKKSRKERGEKSAAPAATAPIEPLSAPGKKVIAGGLGILVLGFIALSFTDAMGRNWASILSPFLIVGGYVVIAIGIFLPEEPGPERPSQDLSQPPSGIL